MNIRSIRWLASISLMLFLGVLSWEILSHVNSAACFAADPTASDIRAHQEFVEKWKWAFGFVNFGFFWLSQLVYGFGVFGSGLAATIFLLAVFKAATAGIVFWHVSTRLHSHVPGRWWLPASFLLAASLMFINPFPIQVSAQSLLHLHHLPTWLAQIKSVYLGKIYINIWHNSTFISLLPFALLLFIQSAKFSKQWRLQQLPVLALLVFVNIIFKPSYLLAWLPAVGVLALAAFWKQGKNPRILLAYTGIAIWAVVLLLLQTRSIYQASGEGQDSFYGSASSLAFGWVGQWRGSGGTLAGAARLAILSMPFAILPALLQPRKALADRYYVLSGLGMLFSLVLVVSVYETGSRAGHMNLFWTGIAANFMFHLSAAIFVLRESLAPQPHTAPWVARTVIYAAIFSLYVAGGGLFLWRYCLLCVYW